jgi:hypothetical protein
VILGPLGSERSRHAFGAVGVLVKPDHVSTRVDAARLRARREETSSQGPATSSRTESCIGPMRGVIDRIDDAIHLAEGSGRSARTHDTLQAT